MLTIERTVEEVVVGDSSLLPEHVLVSDQPVVLRGLVEDWPTVKAGKRSVVAADRYLRGFYKGAPVTAYVGDPSINGRIFYNEDFTGFNFRSSEIDLNDVLDKILESAGVEQPPTFYVGSTLVDRWLPGFRADNDIALGQYNPMMSIWIGNQSRIPAHYDFPDNIACNVVGRRRFILFPPDQLANLYVGPLDFTPSGQSISLVDFHHPDYDKYPLFRKAVESAMVVELDPGDALFIPSMWWHHVEALTDYNVLVNYWWRRSPNFLGAPMNVLYHAIMCMRDLPDSQRKAWQGVLDHYVFNFNGDAVAHIPDHARGVLEPVDDLLARRLRAQLLNKLNR